MAPAVDKSNLDREETVEARSLFTKSIWPEVKEQLLMGCYNDTTLVFRDGATYLTSSLLLSVISPVMRDLLRSSEFQEEFFVMIPDISIKDFETVISTLTSNSVINEDCRESQSYHKQHISDDLNNEIANEKSCKTEIKDVRLELLPERVSQIMRGVMWSNLVQSNNIFYSKNCDESDGKTNKPSFICNQTVEENPPSLRTTKTSKKTNKIEASDDTRQEIIEKASNNKSFDDTFKNDDLVECDNEMSDVINAFNDNLTEEDLQTLDIAKRSKKKVAQEKNGNDHYKRGPRPCKKCLRCDYVPDSKQDLKQHVLLVHQGRLFPCDQCEYAGKRPWDLKKHKETIHEKIQFLCDQCPYTAHNVSSMTQHKRTVHEGERWSCQEPDCLYSGPTKHCLNNHTRVVHQRVKYFCDKCEFSANRMFKLNNHIDSCHLGKTWSCDQCSYIATNYEAFYSHRRKKHGTFKTKARNYPE